MSRRMRKLPESSTAVKGVMAEIRKDGLYVVPRNSTVGVKEIYGQELILDLHGCDATKFTRSLIERFCIELCDLIDMERSDLHFWDDVGVPEEERQTDPKTKGTSAVQFILTSTIVIHTLDLMKAVYVNIFSCKEFDTDEAAEFTANWFDSKDWTKQVVTRR
ncbi:MAG: S-adenosylmethionine decarboxylase [Phycisphaerales bacterium]|nr:MAG: S-adenosylmethionine decarboxylase [Phycisphaerales bacterium]